ncbi:MAG TPA: alpha/beta hydrolase [Rhizomicrobium sp.]|nr:alpha/beta hydrolase [Rhizomicrobium sp.]
MPLDPIMKAFLDQMALQPAPKMHELPAPAARQMFAALMELAGPKDVPIGKVANLTCRGPAGDIPLRVYTPVAASSDVLPALLYFHGGGFVIGDLNTHDGLCRMIANEAGVRVIAVDYRLAPEHKYPAAIEDAFAALKYVEANAPQLGVDANRLAVGGDSAGGAITAVLTQKAKEEGGPSLAFQLLFFPVTQIGEETASLRNHAEGMFLERAGLEWFYRAYLPDGADRSDPRISPLRASSLEDLPPAYLVVAEFDPLHDEGLAYGEKLKKAGVACEIADYQGLVHDFIYLQGVLPQAATALKAAAAALKKALKAE